MHKKFKNPSLVQPVREQKHFSIFISLNVSSCMKLVVMIHIPCVIKAVIVSLRQIGVAYVTATSTALATAVGLNLYTKVRAHTDGY